MKKVLLLLSNGFEAYEASVFTDIIGFSQTGGIDINIESVGMHPTLTCAYGFSVIPNKQINEIDAKSYDALAIPGGSTESGFYVDAYTNKFLHIITTFDKLHKPIAGICTGGMPIAKSLALKGKNGTTFPGKRQSEMATYGVTIQNKDIVVDKNIITSSSPKTGVNVVFKLLEMLMTSSKIDNIKSFFI
jgi:4-methyl-5(b-hydroxyethyl)-thiazole monophosphate biosynthesis